MKVLFINKFLYRNGGSETYIISLGKHLRNCGHKVEYFGMDHERRCVGNRLNLYTKQMDFHDKKVIGKILYPLKTIYSYEARKKIRKVLEDFQPDVCHLNNFNYQLTPSIILEIKKWEKRSGKKCRIIYTAHDYQLLCPNHMCNNPNTRRNCEKCLVNHYYNCFRYKCIHGSRVKSLIGTIESYLWHKSGIYKNIDTIICCSDFMKEKMDENPVFAPKTISLHNFVESERQNKYKKKDYVLYFGRFSQEKGVHTLVNVCRKLSYIPFVFAGVGPLEHIVNEVSNIKNVGFQTGEVLDRLIGEARFTVCPSEWYENCPLSVMESQLKGTPVLGADIGGIPEIIDVGKSGELFESKNEKDLCEKIQLLWNDRTKLEKYTYGCQQIKFDTVSEYCDKLMNIYRGK